MGVGFYVGSKYKVYYTGKTLAAREKPGRTSWRIRRRTNSYFMHIFMHIVFVFIFQLFFHLEERVGEFAVGCPRAGVGVSGLAEFGHLELPF